VALVVIQAGALSIDAVFSAAREPYRLATRRAWPLIRLPPTQTDEGIRAALEIRATYPGVGVLVLSQYVEFGRAMKPLADSADGAGYLLKDRIQRRARILDSVLALMAAGNSSKGIADRLVITLRAVEKYVSGMFGKLYIIPPRRCPASFSGRSAG
jgi:hypothetical protein